MRTKFIKNSLLSFGRCFLNYMPIDINDINEPKNNNFIIALSLGSFLLQNLYLKDKNLFGGTLNPDSNNEGI